MIAVYQSRRAAARARKAIQQLGLIPKTEVYVTHDGNTYVTCATNDPVACAMMTSEGEKTSTLPDMDDVVEMYRREATVRFAGGTGPHVLPVSDGAKRGRAR